MILKRLRRSPDAAPITGPVLWSERAAIVRVNRLSTPYETGCWRVRPREEDCDLYVSCFDLVQEWRSEGFSYSGKSSLLPTHKISIFRSSKGGQELIWEGRFNCRFHRVLLAHGNAESVNHCAFQVIELIARLMLHCVDYREGDWQRWTDLLVSVCSTGNLSDPKTKLRIKQSFDELLPKYLRKPELAALTAH